MKMRNIVLIVSVIAGGLFMSCQSSGAATAQIPGDLPDYDGFISGGYMPGTVYVLNPPNGQDQVLVAQAVQGIVSRNSTQIYIQFTAAYRHWFEESRAKYRFRTTNTELWELVNRFKDSFKGYVSYNPEEPEHLNYAATIAGVLDALPVSTRLVARVRQMGYTELDNASSYDNIQQIITKYGDRLNKKIFLNQGPELYGLRDYGIKEKCIIAWPNNLDPVYDFLDDNAILLGWHVEEVSGVNAASKKQVVTIAADHAYNLSFFSAIAANTHKQKEPVDKDLTAQNGKHYIAFVYSDGDNIQWLLNDGAMDITKFAHDKSAKIPFGWSLAPTLPDFAPVLMDYMYTTAAPTDNFVAATSGFAYMHPSEYYNAGRMDALKEFGKLTAEYMLKSDMKYTEILDEYVNDPNIEVLDAYTENDAIKGVLYKSGNRYSGGRGFLRWSNGKPVVAFRESLWSNINNNNRDIYQMAYRITQYAKNPATIDGYTLINVHAWSHDYSSVEKIVQWLRTNDRDVIVVTPDTLMRLISENVPKTDAQPVKNWNDNYNYPSGLY